MALRYWVGGAGTWDSTTTTNWSATSGGAGGASAPTVADSVTFNASSGAGAVSISASAVCVTCGFNAASITATLTANHPTELGSLSMSAGTFDCSTFNITLSGTINVTGGTFTCNGGTITADSINSTGTGTRAVNLNASTLQLLFGMSLSGTGLTFNAGTSTINYSNLNVTIATAGYTYYNVTHQNAANTSVLNITGANTFNNLTFTSKTTTSISSLVLSADQTINGTLTVPASTILGGTRLFIRSNILGTTRTITAATVSLTDVDLRDIVGTGAASWSGTRLGDCGGNTGITFPTAKTVYWNLVGAPNFSDIGWATTPTGTPSAPNFPLAQDTAVFTDVTGSGVLVTFSYNLGTITFADPSNPRTVAFSFTVTSTLSFYGDVTLSSAIAWPSAGTCTYVGRNKTQTITSAGRTFTGGYTQTTIGGGVVFADAFTTLNTLIVTNGSLSTNYNITSLSLSSNNSNTRAITLGAMVWSLTSTGLIWNTATTTGLTFTSATSKIALTNTTTTVRSFGGGGLTFYNLEIGGATGTSTFTVIGSNTFNIISSTKTVAHTLLFTAATTTTVADFTVKGTAGNIVTIGSATAAAHNLVKTGGGDISVDYMSISQSNAS